MPRKLPWKRTVGVAAAASPVADESGSHPTRREGHSIVTPKQEEKSEQLVAALQEGIILLKQSALRPHYEEHPTEDISVRSPSTSPPPEPPVER
jgi:hypothetical protein